MRFILSPCTWKKHDWLVNTLYFPRDGRTLDEYTGNERKRILVEITNMLEAEIERIYEKESQTTTSLNIETPTKPLSNFYDTHIITSVKGGVGKTLVSLSAINAYVRRRIKSQNFSAVDLNTSNTDLYNIISIRPRPWGNEWDQAEIIGTSNVLYSRHEPYHLYEGAIDFWNKVRELHLSDMLSHRDLIIDTNLVIANLFFGRINPFDIVNSILKQQENRRLFIWIIWTFSALRDPLFIDRGIAQLSRGVVSELANRVEIIHVLNPSALAPAHVDVDYQVKAWSRYEQIQKQFSNTVADLRAAAIPEQVILNLMNQHQQVLNVANQVLQEQLAEERFTEYAYPGLHELLHKEKTLREPIAYEGFQQISEYIKNEISRQPLEQVFEGVYRNFFEGKGRPYNILPISVHDPNLRGYTDNIMIQNLRSIEELHKIIRSVESDVGKFLVDLEQITISR